MAVVCFLAPFSAWSQTTETPAAIAEAPVNLSIPDGNVVGVSNTITISGDDPLESIEVALQIDHPAPDELVISLTGPTGIRIILHNRTFSSQSPFSPIYETITPSVESLKTFLGKNPQGNWTITASDLVAGNSGTLLAWGLRVKPSSLIQPLPPTPVPIPQGLFGKTGILTVEAIPSDAAAGDANNDGLDDLFVVSEQGNMAAIYFSNGETLTDPPLRYTVARPQKIALADFNQDGSLDFAVASQASGIAYTTITVFLANLAGGYSQGFTAQITTALNKLDAFDATGDGIIDLIAGGAPQLLEGVGDGSFKPAVDLVYLGKSYLAKGDLDRDGFTDIFAALSRGGTSPNSDPYVLYGGDMSFLRREKIALEGSIADSFAGRLDEPEITGFATLTKSSSSSTAYSLYTIFEKSPGKITTKKITIASDLLIPPSVPYDLNGDGLDELIYISKTGIAAFQKTLDNSGGQSTLLFEHTTAKKIAIGKFFSDGSVGVGILSSTADVTLIKSSQGPLPTPTPYATPTPSPLPFLFPTFASIEPTPTFTPTPPTSTPTPNSPGASSPDINGDGVVDRLDLLILMQHWGRAVN